MTQPLECDLQRLSCKAQEKSIELRATASEIVAPKPTTLKHFFNRCLKRKLPAANVRKFADKPPSQPDAATPIRFTVPAAQDNSTSSTAQGGGGSFKTGNL